MLLLPVDNLAFSGDSDVRRYVFHRHEINRRSDRLPQIQTIVAALDKVIAIAKRRSKLCKQQKTLDDESLQQLDAALAKARGSVKNLGRYAASWIAGCPNRPSSTAALT